MILVGGELWLVGPEADSKMSWDDAKKWCLAVGGELPHKAVLLQCYKNEIVKSLFQESWYWSGTEFEFRDVGRIDVDAWVQCFNTGFQGNTFKTFEAFVRAVRKV